MTVALRATLAALLPILRWRHHGIGVLQSYIREGVELEVRVHLWHPSLVREGIVGQGDAHDHRFDLTSTVVHGVLRETLYQPVPSWIDDPGALARSYDAWHVENARSAGPDKGFDGDTHPVTTGLRMWTVERVHEAGTTYTLGRGLFHATRVDALAITVCEMREKRGQARLLVPHGTEPVHAFNAHHAALAATQATIDAVIVEAIVALRGAP